MDSCEHCKKTSSELSGSLKKCAKCKTTNYCSRECQKAHWKVHKKVCDRGAKASSSSHPFQMHSVNPHSLQAAIADNALHELPEAEVYKRLIDSYRLRLEDENKFEGKPRGLYSGEDPVDSFNEFLDKAENRGGVLPPWWSKEKRDECLALGMKRSGWSNLYCTIDKPDVQKEYNDPLMPMKVRVLAERIYGRGIGG